MTEPRGGPHARRRRRSSSREGPPAATAPTPEPAPAKQPAPKRRRRSSSRQGPPPAIAPTGTATPAEQPAPKRRQQRASGEPGERGLHDLVGAGSSQLGVSGALRARDVNRPTEQDLAEAERDLVIVHRNWKPAP